MKTVMASLEEVSEAADDALLWRYMDFAKYASVLQSGGFWLPRCDLFDDRFEGSYPIANDASRHSKFCDFCLAAFGYSIREGSFARSGPLIGLGGSSGGVPRKRPLSTDCDERMDEQQTANSKS